MSGDPQRPSITPPRVAALTVAFTVMIALAPAMPHVPLRFGVDLTDLPTLAAVLIGGYAVIRFSLWRDFAPRRAPEAWALALIVPFTLIAALHAGTTHSLFSGPARWALNALLVAFGYVLIRHRADGIRLLKAVIVVATFEAAFGIIAYALHYTGPGGYIGISFTQGQIGGIPVWGRVTGTTGMASTFIAGFFALAMPVSVGLAMTARRTRRWPWIAAAVVIFVGLLLTMSRVPIALGTGAVIVLFLASTRVRVWLPVVVITALLFFATPLRARMTNFSTDRVPLWEVGWRMFTDNWAFGVGPGNYVASLPRYLLPGDPKDMITPHNSLLYLASESGLFAAVALALAIVLSLRFLGRRTPLVLAPMLGVAAFAANAMTTNLYSIASMAIVCWMMAPAVAAIRRSGAPGEGAVETASGSVIPATTRPSTLPTTQPHQSEEQKS